MFRRWFIKLKSLDAKQRPKQTGNRHLEETEIAWISVCIKTELQKMTINILKEIEKMMHP